MGPFEWVALALAAVSAVLLVWAELGTRAALRALVLALGLVLLATFPGCGDVKPDCGPRSGAYTFQLGERIDDGAACVFWPASGALELPASQAGDECVTFGITYYQPRAVEGVGTLSGASLWCEWSDGGAVGDCTLGAVGWNLAGVPCDSSVAVILRRVDAGGAR